MLSLAKDHARLEISADEEFTRISESLRSLLEVCRLNRLAGAVVTSRQSAHDWRSSLRIALRVAAEGAAGSGIRLALVADHFNDRAREDVLAVAKQVGLQCRIYRSEPDAIAWLVGGERRGRAGPP
jgi:hypothetical protein